MTIKNTLTTIGETGYNLIGKMHKSGKASMLSTTRVCEFFFDPKRGNRPSPLYFVDPTKEYSLIDVDSWIELKDNTARKILTKPSLELYNLKPVGNKKDGTPTSNRFDQKTKCNPQICSNGRGFTRQRYYSCYD